MLHKIETKGWDTQTAWCVPTSISFLTGIPLIHSHSRAAFMQNEKLKDVSRVMTPNALLMLNEQGYRAIPIDLTDKYEKPPTLITFAKNLSGYEKCMPLMIVLEGSKDFCHMVVSHYGFFADNWTMKPVPKEDFPHMHKKVTQAFVVYKK